MCEILVFVFLKSPNPSRASSVRYSLNILTQNRCQRTHSSNLFPVFAHLISDSSSRTMTVWRTKSLLIILILACWKRGFLGSELICSILRGQMPYATLWRMQTILHLCPKFAPTFFSTERLGEENVRTFYWDANPFYCWNKVNQFQLRMFSLSAYLICM